MVILSRLFDSTVFDNILLVWLVELLYKEIGGKDSSDKKWDEIKNREICLNYVKNKNLLKHECVFNVSIKSLKNLWGVGENV